MLEIVRQSTAHFICTNARKAALSDTATTMDRIYGWQTGIYDLTRKPYLLGRDRLISSLNPPVGGRILEIGCGTGRNLIFAARIWPKVQLFGFDISSVMLEKAKAEVRKAGFESRIILSSGDAARGDADLFPGMLFDRIFFSYTLSMIPQWERSISLAADRLNPCGSLLIADFGDQATWPSFLRAGLRNWLSIFHVTPRCNLHQVLRAEAGKRHFRHDFVSIYRGYAFMAGLHAPQLSQTHPGRVPIQ
jgi:S-adenosylmethionine-diacylgycerolhomoserine-N-methlytransferase